ncbi:MAG: hypothetical protein K2O24_07075 [Muribaculaceae bacterium]|nr:hypothetical protein [Muribaculaceae bacterium]
MILTLSEIAADVSALAGTSVSRSDRRLRLILPQAALRVMADAPLSSLGEALPLPGEIYPSPVRPDVGCIPLPRDFFRLKAFRLRGWSGAVTTLTSPDDGPLFLLRSSPWPEMSGSPAMPRCYRISFPGGEALEFHRSPGEAAEAVIETALYIPAPVIHDDDTIRLPRPLVEEIIMQTYNLICKLPLSTATSPSAATSQPEGRSV